MATGKPTRYEVDGEQAGEAPDLDAMGNDKRRQVIGRSYGASAGKRVAVYGIAVGLIVLVVIAFGTVIKGYDNRDVPVEATAPWAQSGAETEPPRDVDFARNGPEDTIPEDQIFSR